MSSVDCPVGNFVPHNSHKRPDLSSLLSSFGKATGCNRQKGRFCEWTKDQGHTVTLEAFVPQQRDSRIEDLFLSSLLSFVWQGKSGFLMRVFTLKLIQVVCGT